MAAAPTLVCRVGTGTVALLAADVAEVVRVPGCTRLPNAPPSLVGVANLRGAVLPVVSLARLLGQAGSPGPPGPAARVVVMAGPEPAGLLVDAVEVLSRDGVQAIDPQPLLARHFPPRGRRAGTNAAAVPTVAPTAAAAGLALIALRLAGQEYAIPLTEVAEITRVPAALAALPQMDGTMLGVAAIRGASLPVASLRALLGLPACAPGPAARILVLHGMPVAVLADSVGGTLAVPADAVDPVPPVLRRGTGEAKVQGIIRMDGGRRLVCLLSAAHLFHNVGWDVLHIPPPHARLVGCEGHPTLRVGARDVATPAVQFVVFQLGGEQYGLPVTVVDSVLRRPALTRVPGAPEFVAGVMNLRGRAVPVIDLSKRFGAPGRGSRRVMVVTVAGVQAGFAVDAVTDVLSVPDTALGAAPAFGDTPLFDRVAFERGGQAILLISAATLLQQAERDMLAAWSAKA